MFNDEHLEDRRELQRRYLEFFSEDPKIDLRDIGLAIDCGRTQKGDAARLRELAKNRAEVLNALARFMEEKGIG